MIAISRMAVPRQGEDWGEDGDSAEDCKGEMLHEEGVS